ncbi:response regulator transcription factor [Guptibacillus algicola]|uniref:response regulator transcription factor n=1 Tax=Guptibacillus algicola TaxID=225844 RepID=UPI001CD68C1E|nr:response regulator [Alkalihalobacillus algicola]MCA0988600.1 response regulator [Alkalihalobacillus algicola]
MNTRILVADDEEILRMLIVDTLEDNGYEIDEAEDGREALNLINTHTYDLVLLDYMMPEMTGLEVIETVRAAGKEDVKIMMLTAKAQKKDEEIAKDAGADYFISKPFSPMNLLETVEAILDE